VKRPLAVASVVAALLVALAAPAPAQPPAASPATPKETPAPRVHLEPWNGPSADQAAALDALGMEPRDFGFDAVDVALYDYADWATPFSLRAMEKPLELPRLAMVAALGLGENKASFRQAIVLGSVMSGGRTRRGFIAAPYGPFDRAYREGTVPPPEEYLAAWWREFAEAGGSTPLSFDDALAALAQAAPSAPRALWGAAWTLCETTRMSMERRDEALARLSRREQLRLLAILREHVAPPIEASGKRRDDPQPIDFERLAEAVDDRRLLSAAMDVAAGVDMRFDDLVALAKDEASLAEVRGAEWMLPTPFGWIRLAGETAEGESNFVFDARGGLPLFLSIDLAGEDVYVWEDLPDGLAYPARVVLDFGGANDAHLGHAAAGLGSTSLLYDDGGSDRWEGVDFAQGAAALGVGVAIDDGPGEDLYSIVRYGQGAAILGVAALLDLGDELSLYVAHQKAQGYGEPRGFGVLCDFGGDDSYLLSEAGLLFPSPQSPRRNASLGQGFGMGFRGDFVDGHSLAGGAGALVDLAGNDRYRAGVFAQGAGYWRGVGLLVESGGNDDYDAAWYAQGAAAHFAAAAFVEMAGDDRYRVEMNVGAGGAHDFSVASFLEIAGNDAYDMPNLSLGAGNANGLGAFEDQAGDDVYRLRGAATLGAALYDGGRAARELSPNVGLFIDAAGANRFRFASPEQEKRFGELNADSAANFPFAGGANERGVARTRGVVEGE
jgi:hypothetical protein